jgi:hypothetical protein
MTSKPPVIVSAKRPKPRAPQQPQPEARPLRIVVARKPAWRPPRRKPDPETDQA